MVMSGRPAAQEGISDTASPEGEPWCYWGGAPDLILRSCGSQRDLVQLRGWPRAWAVSCEGLIPSSADQGPAMGRSVPVGVSMDRWGNTVGWRAVDFRRDTVLMVP